MLPDATSYSLHNRRSHCLTSYAPGESSDVEARTLTNGVYLASKKCLAGVSSPEIQCVLAAFCHQHVSTRSSDESNGTFCSLHSVSY
jgi:hypothetical protein